MRFESCFLAGLYVVISPQQAADINTGVLRVPNSVVVTNLKETVMLPRLLNLDKRWQEMLKLYFSLTLFVELRRFSN